jgi:single-strand DNA-binding protein
MKSINEVRLIGNVCKDPEVKTMQSGNKIASFSIATNHSYTNKAGEKIEEPDFHNIVAFNKLAEIIEQYVKKGHPLYVAGRIKNRSWQDDQ